MEGCHEAGLPASHLESANQRKAAKLVFDVCSPRSAALSALGVEVLTKRQVSASRRSLLAACSGVQARLVGTHMQAGPAGWRWWGSTRRSPKAAISWEHGWRVGGRGGGWAVGVAAPGNGSRRGAAAVGCWQHATSSVLLGSCY